MTPAIILAAAACCAQAKSPFTAAHYAGADKPAVVTPAAADRAPETRGFQGIPSIAITPKGKLVCSWYGGGSGETKDNYLIVAESRDEGATWKETVTIKSPVDFVRDFDPVAWLAPNGTMWLFWTQTACEDHWKGDGRLGVWASVCEKPDEEEMKWAEPRRLGNGSIWNKPVGLKNGEWAMPVALYDHHNEDCRALNGVNCSPQGHEWHVLPELKAERGASISVSKDCGKTWGIRGTAYIPNRCFEENVLVEKRDGRLWMLVRAHYGVGEAYSADGGKTWSEGRDSGIYGPNSRFTVQRLKSGNLLMVNHQDPGGQDRTKIMWRKRALLTAFLSEDDGKTWPHKLLIDPRESVSYPDFAQAADGSVYVVHDCMRTKKGYVLLSRITEDDVRRGKVAEGGKSFLNRVISQIGK